MKNKKPSITEVVLRDGQQSLIATRMKTKDMLPILSKMDKVGFSSVEVWGGATYDVCLRFLNEDPWERLKVFKKYFKNTQLQMLLRGKNLVGYKQHHDSVIKLFISNSIKKGINIFRIFDSLNDINNLKSSIEYVNKGGQNSQGTICYTTSPVHNEKYWLKLAKNIEDLGATSLAIKDMAGLLRPFDAFDLVSNLKQTLSIPIHMQTHATTGMSSATNMKAIEAGIDNIDTSISSLSMTYGHSATETMNAIFEGQERHIDLDMEALEECSSYFKDIREKYSEFEGDMKGVDTTMLVKQVPGGMISNLETQLKSNKQEDKIDLVKNEIPEVRKDFGYPPLVTPASQIVGAQALLNVIDGMRYKNLSNESINLIKGNYGNLPGKIKAELKKRVDSMDEVGETLDPEELKNMKKELKELCSDNSLPDLSENEEMLLTYILFPNIALRFFKSLKFD